MTDQLHDILEARMTDGTLLCHHHAECLWLLLCHWAAILELIQELLLLGYFLLCEAVHLSGWLGGAGSS